MMRRPSAEARLFDSLASAIAFETSRWEVR